MGRDSHVSDKSVLADGAVRTKGPKEGTGLAYQASEAELGALRLAFGDQVNSLSRDPGRHGEEALGPG